MKRTDIRETVVSGSFWSIFSNIWTNIATFGATVILARLLTPEAFGIIAISAVFVGVLSLFQDLGMCSAIIQRQNIDDDYLATSFFVSLMAGLMLALLLAAASPVIAGFYGEAKLKHILLVSSTGFLMTPLISIHTTIMTKRFEFEKLAFVNIVTQVSSGLFSVLLAWYGYGVWSLVLGRLLAQPLLIPIVWRMSRWRPRLAMTGKCFRDLFGFSSNLLGFNLLNYFARNTDNLIIGKFLGPEPLGYYSVAYNFMLKPLQLVSWSIGSVLFPVFSAIQDDKARTRSVYLKIIRSISLITFPMMTGLSMVSEEFIMISYGARWRPVVLPLQLLCIVGAVQSIGTTGGVIFNSYGRPDMTFKLGGISAACSVLSFFVGIRWGLNGLIIAYILVTVPNFIIGQYYVNRTIGLRMLPFFSAMAPAAACSAVMVFVLYIFKYLNGISLHLNLSLALASFVLIGTATYSILAVKVFKVPEISEAFEMVRRKL